MMGIFSGIFKYRVTAKAKWKDLRDLKPFGGKRMLLLIFSLLRKEFAKQKAHFLRKMFCCCCGSLMSEIFKASR